VRCGHSQRVPRLQRSLAVEIMREALFYGAIVAKDCAASEETEIATEASTSELHHTPLRRVLDARRERALMVAAGICFGQESRNFDVMAS